MRMPKGWMLVGTNAIEYGDVETKYDKMRRQRKFENAIRKLNKRTEEQMEKDSEKAFNAKVENDSKLLQAFKDKKVKSKEAIKLARELKKQAETVATV